jgi:hypothetical protein
MLRKLWGLIAAGAVVLSLVVQVDPAAARSHAPALALPCQAANASATLSWQDTSGALRGKLTFVNRSSASCSLIGRPSILLLANGTQVLPVVVTLPSSTFTHFGIGTVAPVTLAPRDSAVVSLQWYNWCGARPRTLGLIYALPTGGGGYMLPLSASGHNGGVLVPHCDNQILPSHLDVGLFQHA